MKRSARIAKAKGGGSSGAAATPGADDGDDRARAEKKDYIADNPVWRMNLAHSPTRAQTLMELGKDMYEPFGITDRKTQEYVNASAAWTRQRAGNTDLSRNAIARAKRLVQQDAEAAATNAKTYTIEIKTHSGDIERFPAVIGPGRDGWYRLAVQNAGDIDGSNDASEVASEEEESESEVVRLRRELEAARSRIQVQQSIIEANGLGDALNVHLQDQERQEQQGRDDDGDGDEEEEEEEAPHIHFDDEADDEANDVVDGGIGIGKSRKQKEPKQKEPKQQQQQQQQLKERGLKKADANVVGNAADVEVEQGYDDDDRSNTWGVHGGGGRGGASRKSEAATGDQPDEKVDCADAALQVDLGGGGVAVQKEKSVHDVLRMVMKRMQRMEAELLAQMEAKLQKQKNELVSEDALSNTVDYFFEKIDNEIFITRKKVTEEIKAALALKRTQEIAATVPKEKNKDCDDAVDGGESDGEEKEMSNKNN